MTTADELQALVEQRYALLDAPRWDDPHATTDPRDDEYSRLTDPERYRVVHLRARVWIEVLAERLDVRVERVEPYPDPEHPAREMLRGHRLVPSAPGTRPLLLAEIEVAQEDGEPLPALDISLDRPDLVVGAWPDCGCDACDLGSQYLLEAVDDSILSVVRGPHSMLRGDGWTAEWHPRGGSAGGDPLHDTEQLLALAERVARGQDAVLPPGTEHVVSRSWLD